MGTLEYGARQAIQQCLRLQAGEAAILVADRETAEVADALAAEMQKATFHFRRFTLEDFGERPEDGSTPLPFNAELEAAFRSAAVSVYAAAGKKGELQSFRLPMLALVGSLSNLRHAHMPGVTRQIMEMGMSADYAAVQRLSRRIYERVQGALSARVTSSSGTDFTVRFNPTWRWVNSDGHIQPGRWKNLPDGEVFTCALTADGRAVVDGCLGDYFNREGSLAATPVVLDFADGVITAIECKERPELAADLLRHARQFENGARIGEFAIGTNVGLDRLIGNLLQDEKFPGVHIALGHGCPDKTGADWTSSGHVDAVLCGVTVEVDGEAIIRAGKHLLPTD